MHLPSVNRGLENLILNAMKARLHSVASVHQLSTPTRGRAACVLWALRKKGFAGGQTEGDLDRRAGTVDSLPTAFRAEAPRCGREARKFGVASLLQHLLRRLEMGKGCCEHAWLVNICGGRSVRGKRQDAIFRQRYFVTARILLSAPPQMTKHVRNEVRPDKDSSEHSADIHTKR